MRQILFIAAAMIAVSGSTCQAQWYGRWYGSGAWGGYGGWYSGEGSTPYSNAVRAEAEMTKAQGEAAVSYAQAAAANEVARAQYLENQEKLRAMRREQKAEAEAKKQQRLAEAEERVAKRPPPKPRTELYPRLSTEELDPITGEIHWPDVLKDAAFDMDRATIETALKERAEYGPDDRTAKIIFDTAHHMLGIRAKSVSGLDSQTHLAYRTFLRSLSLEGEHAKEAQ